MSRRLRHAERELATALRFQGVMEENLNRRQEALHSLEEGLVVARDADLTDEVHKTLGELATMASLVGDLQRAYDLDCEAFRIATELGDLVRARWHQHNLACTLRQMGRPEEAAEQMRALIPDIVRLRHGPRTIVLAEDFAAALAELGQYPRAIQLLGAADASRVRLGVPRPIWHEEEIASAIDLARQALSPEVWEANYSQGWSTPVQAALLAAANDPGPAPSANDQAASDATGPKGQTPRNGAHE